MEDVVEDVGMTPLKAMFAWKTLILSKEYIIISFSLLQFNVFHGNIVFNGVIPTSSTHLPQKHMVSVHIVKRVLGKPKENGTCVTPLRGEPAVPIHIDLKWRHGLAGYMLLGQYRRHAMTQDAFQSKATVGLGGYTASVVLFLRCVVLALLSSSSSFSVCVIFSLFFELLFSGVR